MTYSSPEDSSFSAEDSCLDEAGKLAKKEARTKKRKARNQRRYYCRNLLEQQAKGRARNSRNRAAVAKSLWRPTENNAAENDVAENTHPDNDDNDESTANLGTPFPSSITSIVTVPTYTNRRESIMGFTPTLRPAFTNYTPTDSDTDAEDDFVLRHARGRLVYVRRALLRLEDQWGAVDRWAARFVQQWPTMKTESAPRVASWFASVRHQAQMGRHIIQDLSHGWGDAF